MSDSKAEIIGGRYQVIDKLGSGGMGQVFRVVDRLNGQLVALKRLLPPSESWQTSDSAGFDQRFTLAREFRLMASLRHPHVIDVLDYGFDAHKQPYYTMRLLENALSILEAGQHLLLERQIDLIMQVLRALAYLHRRDIIHRDLKPNNVMVENHTVKVLDFGLSVTRGQQQDAGGATAGTIAYIAPEVLLGLPASETSDLYSVGVMAYELLTGRHPFAADNLASMVTRVLQTPPDFMTLSLTPALIYVLDRLMAKKPEERFASALDVMNALNDGLGKPIALETTATRESFLQAAMMVGREAEMQQLGGALEKTLKGMGSAWLVCGESGIGKTRLLDEIAALAMVNGALVLRGQAVEQGSSPYQLWRSALRWLALLSNPTQAEAQVLQRVIPDLAALLERDIPEDTALSARAAQTKLHKIVEKMLNRQHRPVVLILEDLQWAGSESLALLNHINQCAAKMPLLIIGSFRDDDHPEMDSLLAGMTLMRLKRLSTEEISRLSEAMLGSGGRSEQVIELLRRETEGNIFFLIEVVRALAEEAGQLDHIGIRTLPAHVFAGGMQRIIQNRLDAVPLAHRNLLRAAAVCGRQIDVDVLRILDPDADIENWLRDCVRVSVLEAVETEWRFAHDKLRNGVLERLSPNNRRDLHRQIATAIEQAHSHHLEQYAAALAYHWREAGDNAKEIDYDTLAGRQALNECAYSEAIVFLERALLLVEQTDRSAPEARAAAARFKSDIASAQAALGRYQAAQRHYQDALIIMQRLGDSAGQAVSAANLGDIACALNDLETAETFYQQSLALFEAVGDLNGVIRALSSLGNVAYDLDDHDRANEFFRRSLLLSRESGSQWGMAGSFADLGDQESDD